MNLRTILYSGVSLILPEICPACGKLTVERPSPICTRCRRDIFASPSCPTTFSPGIHVIWSCRAYEGALKNCVRAFKYGGIKRLSWVFGQLIDSFLAENGAPSGSADIIIPVPLHPLRSLSRGYNQAELIAVALSSASSISVCRRTLLKTRNTTAQMGLSREQRLRNLKGSFAVVDKSRVAGKTVLLVDDVITTGATLETCAEELLRAGASSVKAFTLARVI